MFQKAYGYPIHQAGTLFLQMTLLALEDFVWPSLRKEILEELQKRS